MCNPPPLPSSSSLLPCRGIISEQTSINAHSSPICLFSPRVTIFQNLNVGNNRQQLAGYVIEREKLERHRERERERERERGNRKASARALRRKTLSGVVVVSIAKGKVTKVRHLGKKNSSG